MKPSGEAAEHLVPESAHQDPFAGLDVPINPVRRTVMYKASLIVAAAAMILLPLIYCGLILLLGYGAYWYAIYGYVYLEVISSVFYRLIVYLGPLVASVIAIFFMFKPLLAPKGASPVHWELKEEEQPRFFAFAKKVSRTVHAPLPKRIFVDCTANASASFDAGPAAFLRSSLVLTVGLPLLREMNTRELAGILAHEFGHFSQGAGMRLSYIVRSINFWFERLIYQRDEWDHKLEVSAKEADFRISVALHLARATVWLTRRILWGLMKIGHLVSTYLMRQMEFDADRHEIRLAGSSQFQGTYRKLISLGAGCEAAFSKVADSWQDGQLPKDFSSIVSYSTQSLDRPTLERLNQEVASAETGIWDTHPSARDRVNEALRQKEPGTYLVELPCAVLFEDFDALSCDCSAHFYRGLIGDSFRKDQLVTTDMVIRQSAELKADNDAFQRMFGDVVDLFLPLQPRLPDEYTLNKDHLVESIRRQYAEQRDNLDAIGWEAGRREKRRQHVLNIVQGKALLQAGYTIDPVGFSLTVSDVNAALKAEGEMRRSLGLGSAELLRFLEPLRKRFEASLLLYSQSDQLNHALTPGELVNVENILASHSSRFQELEELFGSGVILFAQDEDLRESEPRHGLINEYCSRLAAILNALNEDLKDLAYPFVFSGKKISVAEYLFERGIPPAKEYGDVLGLSTEVLRKLSTLYMRIMGRLATYAETVERGLGVEPLAVVKKGNREYGISDR